MCGAVFLHRNRESFDAAFTFCNKIKEYNCNTFVWELVQKLKEIGSDLLGIYFSTQTRLF